MLFVSCSQRINTSISSYHQITPSDVSGHTIVVLPSDEKKNGSLEFGQQKKLAENGLREMGWHVVDENYANSFGVDYVAFFGYAVGDGREQVYSYSVPIYGQTGTRSAQTTGTFSNFGSTTTYSGTTTYTPQYRITGYQSGVGSTTVYDRAAVLNIYALSPDADPKRVYEASIASTGSKQQITDVLDEMMIALFNDFWHQGNRQESITLQE